ncbi:MAG: cupin domain-containing protein [Solirubrobacteraceae bacterium]
MIQLDDLPGNQEAHRFDGAEHGGTSVSFFLAHSPPGAGPKLHRHPYPEIFILQAGRARFQIEDMEITAEPGQIVLAPAGVPHASPTAAARNCT